MNAIFTSIFSQHFPALAAPNFNLPDGCGEDEISPEPEVEESPYAPDSGEPRERE